MACQEGAQSGHQWVCLVLVHPRIDFSGDNHDVSDTALFPKLLSTDEYA